MGLRRVLSLVLSLSGAISALVVLPALPSAAVKDVAHDRVVNPNPVNWTPHVLNGRVRSIAQVGDRIIVGGSFTQVRNATSTTVLSRSNLFSFDATTGAIDNAFQPTTNGEVYEVASAGDGTSVFVGGNFTSVNGASGTSRVTRLNISNGQVRAPFRSPGFNGTIKDLVPANGRLYVAGSFSTPRSAVAALNRDSGTLESFSFTFSEPRLGGAIQVLKLGISPDGSRMIPIGNFNRINGASRPQIGMIDLTTNSLTDWQTQRFFNNCSSSFQTYMRDIDVAPDNSYFVVVTTGAYQGGANAGVLCDTATRWELDRSGAGQQPTWVDYTGGDSLYSVAVTGHAVYVGGHQRWMNNPFAGDAAGPGAVPRNGIAALDPINGLPFSWNPGRERGAGVYGFLSTPAGLWVGSDTDRFAGEFHAKVAMAPVTGGVIVPLSRTGTLPGDTYLLGNGGAGGSGLDDVIRRGFTGTSVTSSATVGNGGESWRNVRGAFMVNGTLYTGWSDGAFYARSYNGTTFGTRQTVNLFGLTAFASELPNVTGMFFHNGRLYYTLAGQTSLFYRYFTPESRIVGAQRFTASGNVTGVNWATVAGMFQAGDRLYFGSSATANLSSLPWNGSAPVPGTPTVHSGPGSDGRSWNSRGLFLNAQ